VEIVAIKRVVKILALYYNTHINQFSVYLKKISVSFHMIDTQPLRSNDRFV
jgi:hypothetical protein